MSFDIKGVEEVLKNMEDKLGERRVSRIVNKTLNESGEDFKKGLAQAVSSYRHTGATVDEVVRSRSSRRGGNFSLRVGWAGPKKRYKLVHLNEFGYVRWGRRYSPRGMGVIRKHIDTGGRKYLVDVRTGLEEITK